MTLTVQCSTKGVFLKHIQTFSIIVCWCSVSLWPSSDSVIPIRPVQLLHSINVVCQICKLAWNKKQLTCELYVRPCLIKWYVRRSVILSSFVKTVC